MPRTHNKIEAVLFDAGNTLASLDHEIMAAASGIHDVALIREADRRIRAVINDKFERGVLTDFAGEYYGGMLRNAGLAEDQIPAALARVAAAEKIFPIWRRANPEARPAIEALKHAGIRVAVVSNSDGRVETLLAATALADLFEFILDSHLEGVSKPDPTFFLMASTQLGIDPTRCAYVGDIPSVDVTGARAAGMLPILYDPLSAWPDWTGSARVVDLREVPTVIA